MNVLVNIDVADLEKATRFYCEALGLKAGRRFESAVELLGAATPIYLLAKRAGSRACVTSADRRDYRRHWTPVHLDFVVPEVPEAVRRAVAAGAGLESGIETNSWGRIAMLSDPFGNGFCLLEFLGRGYDEIALTPQASG